MNIVLTDAKMKIMQSVWEELQALWHITVTDNDDEETLIRVVADTNLIDICYAEITLKVIQSGRHLNAILKWSVGVDSIGMETAIEYELPVCHCPTWKLGLLLASPYSYRLSYRILSWKDLHMNSLVTPIRMIWRLLQTLRTHPTIGFVTELKINMRSDS